MRVLNCLTMALVVGLTSFSLLAASQPTPRPPNLAEKLNEEAKAPDLAGIHEYSQHLILLIAPEKTDKAYIDSLSDRLAKAELMARGGKGTLIPEENISRSYNNLIKRIGAPASFQIDEATVRKFRRGRMTASPITALISVDRNGTNCNPGEAVFLLYQFLDNPGPFASPDGEKEVKPADQTSSYNVTSAAVSSTITAGPNVDRLLSLYSLRHNRHATIKLLNDVAQTLGF